MSAREVESEWRQDKCFFFSNIYKIRNSFLLKPFRGVAMALNWILGNFSLNSLKSETIEFSDNWESGQEKVLWTFRKNNIQYQITEFFCHD